MTWYQLFVKEKAGTYPHSRSVMSKIDGFLLKNNAFVVSSKEGPIRKDDGTWEVRVSKEAALSGTKEFLIQNGLEIIRETTHDQKEQVGDGNGR